MAKSIALRSIVSIKSISSKKIATKTAPVLSNAYNFPVGSYTFTPPKSGYWKFVGWGTGGTSVSGVPGASGAYTEITRFLGPGQSVALVVGGTTITLPDGTVASAGAASGSTPGVASGGDVNLAGSFSNTSSGATGAAGLGTGGGAGGSGSGAADGGAGAPGVLPFRGGKGGDGGGVTTGSGPGAGGSNGGLVSSFGSSGLVIVVWAGGA